jgi:hypothetical protein
MKKRFFYGFAVTMAVAAITFSGISKSNASVTDFTELKAKAEVLCDAANDECETPRHVYSNMKKAGGGGD